MSSILPNNPSTASFHSSDNSPASRTSSSAVGEQTMMNSGIHLTDQSSIWMVSKLTLLLYVLVTIVLLILLVKILFPDQSVRATSVDPKETSSSVPSRTRPNFGKENEDLSTPEGNPQELLTYEAVLEKIHEHHVGGDTSNPIRQKIARQLSNLSSKPEDQYRILAFLKDNGKTIRLLSAGSVKALYSALFEGKETDAQNIVDEPGNRSEFQYFVIVQNYFWDSMENSNRYAALHKIVNNKLTPAAKNDLNDIVEIYAEKIDRGENLDGIAEDFRDLISEVGMQTVEASYLVTKWAEKLE